MNIKLCTEEDAEDVGTVLAGSGLASDIDNGKEMFLNEIRRGDRYFLAFDDEPLGIVSWIFHGEARHGLFELYHIGVVPAAKGKGVASALFNKLIKDAKGVYAEKGGKIRKLYLLTHEDNERARGFYEKMGMAHETTLKSHFHDGLGECVYSIFFE